MDELNRGRHASRVVPMPVRQHHTLDRAEADPKPPRVPLKRIRLGARVEEDGVARIADVRCDQERQTPRRAAQARRGELLRPVSNNTVEFAGHIRRYGGEDIERGVDYDTHLKAIDG